MCRETREWECAFIARIEMMDSDGGERVCVAVLNLEQSAYVMRVVDKVGTCWEVVV